MAIRMQLKSKGNEFSENGESEPQDVSGCKGVNLMLDVTRVSGTTPTLDVWIEHSPDGINWRSLSKDNGQGIFPRMTDTAMVSIHLTKFSRLIRTNWTIGGTSPRFTFEVSAAGRA